MKAKIIGLFIFFFLLGLFGVSVRRQVKQVLPRTGEVEIVGGVYTPYLLLDSALYFLKGWDESLDFAFARGFSDKARFELIFANKRLLEMEKLARGGNYTFVPRLVDSFLRSLGRAIDFSKEALKHEEDIEELTWFLQESVQDQQKIFKKIVSQLPEEKRAEVLEAQEQSVKTITDLLREIHKLPLEEF